MAQARPNHSVFAEAKKAVESLRKLNLPICNQYQHNIDTLLETKNSIDIKPAQLFCLPNNFSLPSDAKTDEFDAESAIIIASDITTEADRLRKDFDVVMVNPAAQERCGGFVPLSNALALEEQFLRKYPSLLGSLLLTPGVHTGMFPDANGGNLPFLAYDPIKSFPIGSTLMSPSIVPEDKEQGRLSVLSCAALRFDSATGNYYFLAEERESKQWQEVVYTAHTVAQPINGAFCPDPILAAIIYNTLHAASQESNLFRSDRNQDKPLVILFPALGAGGFCNNPWVVAMTFFGVLALSEFRGKLNVKMVIREKDTAVFKAFTTIFAKSYKPKDVTATTYKQIELGLTHIAKLKQMAVAKSEKQKKLELDVRYRLCALMPPDSKIELELDIKDDDEITVTLNNDPEGNYKKLLLAFFKRDPNEEKVPALVFTQQNLSQAQPTEEQLFREWQARVAAEPHKYTKNTPNSWQEVCIKALNAKDKTVGNWLFSRSDGRTIKCLQNMGFTVTKDQITDTRHHGKFTKGKEQIFLASKKKSSSPAPT